MMLMKPEYTGFELEFLEETGKEPWLPTYSEKYQEERFYLSPDYTPWLMERIDKILNKDHVAK